VVRQTCMEAKKNDAVASSRSGLLERTIFSGPATPLKRIGRSFSLSTSRPALENSERKARRTQIAPTVIAATFHP